MTREEIKDELYRMLSDVVNGGYPKRNNTQRGRYREAVKKAIEALEQEPCKECVSREAVLMEIDKYLCGVPFDEKGIDIVIKELPPVTPQPNKCGEWSDDGFCGDYVCSVCKHEFDLDIANMRGFDFALPKFCPNCGAKMSEIPTGSESEG